MPCTYCITHYHVSCHADLSRMHPHVWTALRHIGAKRTRSCLYACICSACTRLLTLRFHFTFHLPIFHTHTHTLFIIALPHITPIPLYLFLFLSLIALSVSFIWMKRFNKLGGRLARRHCYRMSMLHMDLACRLLRTHVAYGIAFAIAYLCCITGFALAIAYPCCIRDCDPQPPCHHASHSCHLRVAACCYSKGIGLSHLFVKFWLPPH